MTQTLSVAQQARLDLIKKQIEADEKLRMPLTMFPDPLLSKPCARIEVIDDGIKQLVERMCATMRLLDWGVPVGLAAPQVGQSVQLFIALKRVFINPELIWVTRAPKSLLQEGCYSGERNHFNKVWRSPSVRLRWQDLEGVIHEERFNDFPAQVIQHEYEHLNLGPIDSSVNHIISKP